MRSELLHVIVPVSNPARWRSRIKLARDNIEHLKGCDVQVYVIECAYGDIPHVLGDIPGVVHIPVRARTHAWNKEQLINIARARLPWDAKYIAWVDADIKFRKIDWARETVYALQHFDFVQPWSHCYDLGPGGEHMQLHESFCFRWFKRCKHIGRPGGGPYTFSHPGFAWAATRTALEHVGGLLDIAILGAADHHMALSLIGKADMSLFPGLSDSYVRHVKQWEARASRHICGHIGHINVGIEHHWHGDKKRRQYLDRRHILTRHKFCPDTDIKRNAHGLFELAGNKPELIRDVHLYNVQRCEDANIQG